MSEDATDDKPPSSLPQPCQQSPGTKLTIRLMMKGKEVGSIIGKGGEIISGIRDKSGCKIHITDSSVPERLVTVTGSTSEIVQAFGMIYTRIVEGGAGGDDVNSSMSSPASNNNHNNYSNKVTLQLVIAVSRCGALIGKNGCKIKEIRERSCASIQVSSEMLPNSTERLVTISGSRDAITQCVSQVCSVLLEAPPQSSPILYKPKSRPPLDGSPLDAAGSRSSSILGLNGGGLRSTVMAALAAMASSQIRNARSESSSSNRELDSASFKMPIPNELIGCIIGKRGSKIAEIRRMSGADISITEGSDANSPVSELSICGPSDSIALARSLITISTDMQENRPSGTAYCPSLASQTNGDYRGSLFSLPATSGSVLQKYQGEEDPSKISGINHQDRSRIRSSSSSSGRYDRPSKKAKLTLN